jgi:hypothetical protein
LYFRDVPLYEYEYRRTLFTNAYFARQRHIDLGVATLSPSSFAPVTTVWASLTERFLAGRGGLSSLLGARRRR